MDEFLNLRDAARVAGLSVPTLRRRIRSGALRARLRPGPFGDQWEVAREDLGGVRSARSSITVPDRREIRVDQAMHDPDRIVEGHDHGGVPDPVASVGVAVVPREYWRGRWEEAREALDRLERLLASGARSPVPDAGALLAGEEVEELRAALRERNRELAQARNLVDGLRRDKARLESEVEALRARLRGGAERTREIEVASRESPASRRSG